MATKEEFIDLAKTYPGPYPRFNYYPRISDWKGGATDEDWVSSLNAKKNKEVDLYIHFPFCKNFCHFCGCNIKVQSAHDAQKEYLDALKKEIEGYHLEDFKVKNLFFGGGTPNATDQALLEDFLEFLFARINKTEDFNFITELDLRIDEEGFLKKLKSYSLNGISFGIQDLNPQVLNIIGRKTNVDELFEKIMTLNEYEFQEVGIDLLYGLPKQNTKYLPQLDQLLKKSVIDKVSLYPFAHVPWFSDYYPEWDRFRPSIEEKVEYYYEVDRILLNNDFFQIGYGHYYKKSSSHYKDFLEGKISRTVMGYFNGVSDTLIGCGVSAISISPTVLKKNHKILGQYVHGKNKISKSHFVTEEELKKWRQLQEISSLPNQVNNTQNFHELERYFIPHFCQTRI